MKKYPLFLSALLVLAINAQAQTSPTYDPHTILAFSGLSLRTAPSLASKKLATIPFGTVVSPEAFEGDSLEIEGRTGNWCKVTFDGQTGYAFSGYLLEGEWIQEIPEEQDYVLLPPSYYCQAVPVSPALNWYGLFCETGKCEIREVEIRLKRYHEYQLEQEYVDVDFWSMGQLKVETDQAEQAQFLIGTRKGFDLGTIEAEVLEDWRQDLQGKWLFPEETYTVEGSPNRKPAIFKAFEKVVPQEEAFAKVFQWEYQIYHRWDSVKTVNISDAIGLNEPAERYVQYENARLVWHGDLNQDGLLDFIMMDFDMIDSCGSAQRHHLFLSDRFDPENPVKKVAVFEEWGCL